MLLQLIIGDGVGGVVAGLHDQAVTRAEALAVQQLVQGDILGGGHDGPALLGDVLITLGTLIGLGHGLQIAGGVAGNSLFGAVLTGLGVDGHDRGLVAGVTAVAAALGVDNGQALNALQQTIAAAEGAFFVVLLAVVGHGVVGLGVQTAGKAQVGGLVSSSGNAVHSCLVIVVAILDGAGVPAQCQNSTGVLGICSGPVVFLLVLALGIGEEAAGLLQILVGDGKDIVIGSDDQLVAGAEALAAQQLVQGDILGGGHNSPATHTDILITLGVFLCQGLQIAQAVVGNILLGTVIAGLGVDGDHSGQQALQSGHTLGTGSTVVLCGIVEVQSCTLLHGVGGKAVLVGRTAAATAAAAAAAGLGLEGVDLEAVLTLGGVQPDVGHFVRGLVLIVGGAGAQINEAGVELVAEEEFLRLVGVDSDLEAVVPTGQVEGQRLGAADRVAQVDGLQVQALIEGGLGDGGHADVIGEGGGLHGCAVGEDAVAHGLQAGGQSDAF